MNWSIKLGIIFILLELVWVCLWFAAMVPFNILEPEVPAELEASHFAGIVHLFGLPIIIWTVYVLIKYHKGEEREEPTHLRWHMVAIFGVALLDCRGVIHVALRYSNFNLWYDSLFAAVAIIALILTGLELIWLSVITIKWWSRIFNDIKEMWSSSNKIYLDEHLIFKEPIRKMVGLKSF